MCLFNNLNQNYEIFSLTCHKQSYERKIHTYVHEEVFIIKCIILWDQPCLWQVQVIANVGSRSFYTDIDTVHSFRNTFCFCLLVCVRVCQRESETEPHYCRCSLQLTSQSLVLLIHCNDKFELCIRDAFDLKISYLLCLHMKVYKMINVKVTSKVI